MTAQWSARRTTRWSTIATVLVASSVAALTAQPRADFTGTWVSPGSERSGRMRIPLSLDATGRVLTLTTTIADEKFAATFRQEFERQP